MLLDTQHVLYHFLMLYLLCGIYKPEVSYQYVVFLQVVHSLTVHTKSSAWCVAVVAKFRFILILYFVL
jgi:hypothetical protein